MIISPESHLDHGLGDDHIEFLKREFKGRKGFFIETFTLPVDLDPLKSGLYGPLSGDEPITEDRVSYETRGDRPGESRMLKAPHRDTRTMTVIAGPDGDESCVLYTSYGGPNAPREPFDPAFAEDPKGLAESKAFWAEHALALPEDIQEDLLLRG